MLNIFIGIFLFIWAILISQAIGMIYKNSNKIVEQLGEIITLLKIDKEK